MEYQEYHAKYDGVNPFPRNMVDLPASLGSSRDTLKSPGAEYQSLAEKEPLEKELSPVASQSLLEKTLQQR